MFKGCAGNRQEWTGPGTLRVAEFELRQALLRVETGKLSSKHLLNSYFVPRTKCYSYIISFGPYTFLISTL